MLSYEKVSHNRKQFLSLTGMEVAVFVELHTFYKRQWHKYIKEFKLNGEKRSRPHRERKDGVLTKTEDQLLFVLHYLKSNSIQEHHAASYGLHQSQCNQRLHLLLRLLHLALQQAGQLPERDSAKLQKALRGLKEVFIDGTERTIERPQDSTEQKDCYSGKKKGIG